MPRRANELSVRRPLVAPRRPAAPGREAAVERKGVELRPLAGPDIPIVEEQEEALLARFETWRATTNGSLPEFIVWEFLTINKKQVPQVDFVYQHPLFGGRTHHGGYILDFYFPLRREGWNVQGERYHLEAPQSRARDAIMKAQLTAEGMKVILLWEDDLLSRPDFVLSLAWERGESVRSRAPV